MLSPKSVAGQVLERDHCCGIDVWCVTMDLRQHLWALPAKKKVPRLILSDFQRSSVSDDKATLYLVLMEARLQSL